MESVVQKTYYSNANLLISGEYYVLIGAKALAVPLKYGQDLKVDAVPCNKSTIQWQAFENGKVWFEVDFDSKNLEINNTNDKNKALWLQNVLKALLKLKPELLQKNNRYTISTKLNFNTNWGWGSSSSLILNLANWAEVDAFELNRLISKGSGYDIAASGSASPIIYQLQDTSQQISPAPFNPGFKKNIHFVYLGKKQSSAESIKKSIHAVNTNKSLVSEISSLTEKMAEEKDITHFMKLMREHENIISKSLKIPQVKEKYFNSFEGEIKSLGAWGGDFAMAVSSLPEILVKQYFKTNKLETIFSYSEIVRDKI